MDQAMAVNYILLSAPGQPAAKRVRWNTIQLQARLKTLCCKRREGELSIEDMLCSVAHTIGLDK